MKTFCVLPPNHPPVYIDADFWCLHKDSMIVFTTGGELGDIESTVVAEFMHWSAWWMVSAKTDA